MKIQTKNSARYEPLTLAIIVPVFRDNAALERCLTAPAHRALHGLMTVVLGEPDPAARSICAAHSVACIEAPQAGRAGQMNYAAAHSDARILLFLHADTQLPVGAVGSIQEAIAAGALGGGFSRRFDHPGRFLRGTCRLADWRGRRFGWLLGDQAIFVRRDAFERLGGFPLRPQFEDLEFSRQLRRMGKTVLLPERILTSARRFEQRGPIRQTLRDLWLTLGYWWRV